MKKKLKMIIIILMLFGLGVPTSVALAQTGVEVPCVNCEQYTQRTEPTNGVWYNKDQTAQGFNFDTQNGRVSGIYYGYDEEGTAIWLTFTAALTPSEEVGVMWTIDATLNHFSNSNCFNCEVTGFDITDYGRVKMKFRHKNLASVSFDGGPWQNITPFIFGHGATADFPHRTEYLLPNLDGLWTFVYHVNGEAVTNILLIGNQWAFYSEVLRLTKKNIRETPTGREVTYAVARYFPPPEVLIIGTITCKLVEVEGQLRGPTCTFENNDGFWFDQLGVSREFNFPLGGLGAYRIFGETIDGHTFEAIKIDSTPFNS
ncbi:MAG: hypothetical protein IMF09_12375 [Proteobacteria bacterium]|nr:hypothetical protein [Pseudomonadota bacterium]